MLQSQRKIVSLKYDNNDMRRARRQREKQNTRRDNGDDRKVRNTNKNKPRRSEWS